MSIKAKIIALNAIAASLSLFLGGILVFQSWKKSSELENFGKVSQLLIQMIKLGDAWTHESGGVWATTTHHRTAAEVPAGVEEYRNRIAKTEKTTQELLDLVASMNLEEHSPRFRKLMQNELNFSERLEPIRNRQLVDKADPWPTTLLYNDQIKWLFSLIPQIATETTDAELVRKVIVSDLSLQTQLMINRHVGLLNYALSSGAVTEMVTTRFEAYLSDSRPLLDRIEMIIDTESLPTFHELVDNEAFAYVEDVTKRVFDGGFNNDGSKKSFPPALVERAAEETASLEGSAPQFSKYILERISDYTEERAAEASADLYQSLAAALFALLASALGGWYIISRIKRSIIDVSQKLEKSSRTGRKLSQYVAEASGDLATGCSQQAASVEEIHATMEQIKFKSNESVERVERVLKLANDTSESAQASSTSMRRMRSAMGKIQGSSDEIANIAKEIEEIAFQTNILALNAAVEAARAGEAGAGFAIVADEVRNLAQKSAVSANSTREKIENAHRSVKEGTSLSSEVDQQLSSILGQIEEFKTAMREVEGLSEQQRVAVDQVSGAISDIDNVTQRNAAAAEESASASAEMDNHSRTIIEQIQSLEELLIGKRGIDLSNTPEKSFRTEKQASPQRKATPAQGLTSATREQEAELWN
ncbi:methyl-accepting chemotaxis protein [Pelagicoccus sp. SDUM812003]|uniref:methyl-accepting chemotaxis protein n=1 Tax=Pelagicoccus sp. SDUM812003 TaxID=3041267 RepID=UPI0028106D1F|nr:methyl-accepting chemotaxis protein [Pelagicoccus sp. SDUM812003]MDQ8205616.1 methyl-accepting chemotaxis protein [Pelagicoccus sp. SDUM812003]